MNTRQAIQIMRQNNWTGQEMIDIARHWCSQWQHSTLADGLIEFVLISYGLPRCTNCGGSHHIQDCGEIAFWLDASEASFKRFMEDNK